MEGGTGEGMVGGGGGCGCGFFFQAEEGIRVRLVLEFRRMLFRCGETEGAVTEPEGGASEE